MRCEDVIGQLAAPSGSADQAAISDHLARCGECAKWAERDAKLDRIWELTRPEALAPETWESIWARATSAVDQTAGTDVLAPVLQFRRRAVWFMAIAQVAAAAVAIVCLSPSRPDPGKASPIVVASVEVDQGEVPFIQFDQSKTVALIDVATNENPDNVSASLAFYNFYNELEGSSGGEGNLLQ